MTDQEKIAQQFGLTIEQLNATSPHERERAIAESLSSDERSMAAMFKMSEADIAEMVSDRAAAPRPDGKADDSLKRWQDNLAHDPWVDECLSILGDVIR